MQRAADHILTYDQYAAIEKRGFAMPYIVEVECADQKLLFYGSEHTNDPAHPQFQDIEKRWRTFVAEAKRPIALVEGRFDEVPEKETASSTTSIIDGGEAQFVVHLARRDGIAVVSPEPDRAWEANQLATAFGRDSVVFYYFVRQIGWWQRIAKKPNIRAEAATILRLMQKAYQWNNVDFSIKRMTQIHKELFGKPFAWDDAQWLYDITTPVPPDYLTNKIARRSGELRDEYILGQIARYWHAGRSPFAIFGAAHAIRLEPALQKLHNSSSKPA